MPSRNSKANRAAVRTGNMILNPNSTSGEVNAYRVPMALAIARTDPMAAKMTSVTL
jgi:hypothetical protein